MCNDLIQSEYFYIQINIPDCKTLSWAINTKN